MALMGVTMGTGRQLNKFQTLQAYDGLAKSGRLTDENARARKSLWQWLAADERWRYESRRAGGKFCRCCGYELKRDEKVEKWESDGLGSCPDPLLVEAA